MSQGFHVDVHEIHLSESAEISWAKICFSSSPHDITMLASAERRHIHKLTSLDFRDDLIQILAAHAQSMLQYPYLEFSAISFAAGAAYHAAHCRLPPVSE